MGQKTNPKAFRLIAAQEHQSKWYSSKQNYSGLVNEDYFIRKKINDLFAPILTLSNIDIFRANELMSEQSSVVQVQICSMFPRKKEFLKKITKRLRLQKVNLFICSKTSTKEFITLIIKKLLKEISRYLQYKLKKVFFINLHLIENPYTNVNLIGKIICEQIANRIPFRRILKQTITKVQRAKMNGVKIELSGRLNGAEIARSEWKKEGKIPLHTLKALIDYSKTYTKTIYGIIGVKVWLFKNSI